MEAHDRTGLRPLTFFENPTLVRVMTYVEAELNDGTRIRARRLSTMLNRLPSGMVWRRDLKTPGKFWLWQKKNVEPHSQQSRYMAHTGFVCPALPAPRFVFRHIGFLYLDL